MDGIFMLLAQGQEQAVAVVSLIDTIIKGGLPMFMMVTLAFVLYYFFNKEKEYTKKTEELQKQVGALEELLRTKIEELLVKQLQAQTPISEALAKTNQSMDSFTASAEITRSFLQDLRNDINAIKLDQAKISKSLKNFED